MTRSIRDDRASAMVLAIGLLTVLLVFGSLSVAVARQANSGANQDRKAKRALAAADAGVAQAGLRLAFLQPDASRCLAANAPWTVSPTAGECPSAVTGSPTTGGSFGYHGTPQLGPSESCARTPAEPPSGGQTDHCVTSTGEVGGVKRRVQARIRVDRIAPYPYPGLLGLESVRLLNSVSVGSSAAGSNGTIEAANSVSPCPTELRLPTGATKTGSSCPGTVSPRVTVPPWAPPSEDADFEAAENANVNANGSLGTGYDSATRRLVVRSGRVPTLTSGTYHLCDLYVAEDGIRLAPGANVTIFVDHATRPGADACGPPSTTLGRFCADNSVDDPGINWGQTANQLRIRVYGNANPGAFTTGRCNAGGPSPGWNSGGAAGISPSSDVVLGNSVRFRGIVHAWRSDIRVINSVGVNGALAGRRLALANSISFAYPAGLNGGAPSYQGVRQLSWVECRSDVPTPSDPESGCT